jgi:DNA-binding NarL/FixJ family response regulator
MFPHVQVLLVEDDEGEALLIQKMLAEASQAVFRVMHVVSLKNALTVLNIKKFDVVLLDLSLPDSHGYETVSEYTAHSVTPFIVLTGNDDLTMAMRTTAMGAQDYILKHEIKTSILERTILLALNKYETERKRQRRSYDTLAALLPPEQATVAMLGPRCQKLIEAWEDLEGMLATNVPGLMGDVHALSQKHQVPQVISEIRTVLRGFATSPTLRAESPPPLSGRPHLQDRAIELLDSVQPGGQDTLLPESWDEADELFDEVAQGGT